MSRKPRQPAPETLTTKELERRWKGRLSPGTIRNWRSLGRGPGFQRVAGGRVVYSRAAILAFEALHDFRKPPTTKEL
jgi:hypothetical protein